jgi:hypothetical protein
MDSFKRKLKYGGYSVIITVIFITAAILLNIVFGMLFGNLNLRFDLSERGMYSIENSTREYLAALDDVINIYFCSTEEQLNSFEYTFRQVIEIAQRFTEANSSFNLHFVNRLTNPQLLSRFGADVNDTDIIIESERTGRFRIVPLWEYRIEEFFFMGEQVSYDDAVFIERIFEQPVQRTLSAGAEQAFLSAIMTVSDVSPVRVAFTQGFGENGYSGMGSLLYTNGYTVDETDMLTAPVIDTDIDFLIIFSPLYDYSLEARRRISDWLDNGGNYGKTLLYFPFPDMPDTPNLDAFMAEWGLFAEYGFVLQGNPNFSFDPEGYVQFVAVTGEAFAGDGALDAPLVASFIRPVTRLFESRQSIETYSLAEALPGAAFNSSNEDNDDRAFGGGNFSAIAMSCKSRFEGFDELTSRVIVFGTPSFFLTEMLMTPQFSNAQFLLNIFGDISGRSDLARQARILPKSFHAPVFEITMAQANAIAIVFIIVVPALIIAAGLVVFFRRRYR